MKQVNDFLKMKADKEKIAMITAYDYSSARLAENSGLDCILVGDSLGMVIQGRENTLKVTVEDIVYHCSLARRGAKNTFLIADMPYMSFHINAEETKKNAFRMIIDGEADAVKLEGGSENRLSMIRAIVDCEIPVCGHVGLTPQSIHKFGGYKVQGKDDSSFRSILEEARKIEEAGAFMIVLEGIPELLGKEITESLQIPTIGIGAGRFTDGQVMVFHDILGLSDMQPKFVKQYKNIGVEITSALQSFSSEVKQSAFPERKHVYYPSDKE